MALSFAENRLFGREQDIAYLMERCGRRGLTAVVGKPQMGKSWLLTEVARRLEEQRPKDGRLSLTGNGALVGYFESQGEFADMFPSAVQDLYVRWLEDAGYREQAQVAFEEQREGLIGKMGKLVGGLVADVSKAYGKGAEIAGGLVKQMFEGLAQADEDLKNGPIKLPELQLDQSRELLRIVCTATKRGAVLILDQWEKSPDLDKEKKILDAFLQHAGDESWPVCHVVVGTRDDAKPKGFVEDLVALYPSAKMRVLVDMTLTDAGAATAMLTAVRAEVAATKGVGDEALLGMIGGDPRVLARWTHPENVEEMRTGEDLERVAGEANSYEYLTFTRLLGGLGDEDRALAIRLVLLPLASRAEQWDALRPVALEGAAGKVLDKLKRTGVLETSSPPSYGHATRFSAAVGWFADNCEEEMRDEANGVVLGLAGAVTNASADGLPFLESLAGVRRWRVSLKLPRLAGALCESAYSLLSRDGVATEVFSGVSLGKAEEGAVRLFSMGLLNALNEAKRLNQLAQRDRILEELRALERTCSQDSIVRESLVRALMNTMYEVKLEGDLDRRDALLKELLERVMEVQAGPGERVRLAMGLYNTVNDATQEAKQGRAGALAQREDCLVKLEQLAAANPMEGGVREWVAKGLSNRLGFAKQESDLEVRDAVLQRLRQLGARYPEDGVVRGWLANGLFATLDAAAAEGKPERQEMLLEELRVLRRAYPEDAAVRRRLGAGLFSALLDTRDAAGTWLDKEAVAGRADALVEELRALGKANPEDESARKWWANGLLNGAQAAARSGATERAKELVAELHGLIDAHPEDAFLRGEMAPLLVG
jgi:hypothetical protein